MVVTAMVNATVTITIIDTGTQRVFFMDTRLHRLRKKSAPARKAKPQGLMLAAAR
jgi:hypothetical protein